MNKKIVDKIRFAKGTAKFRSLTTNSQRGFHLYQEYQIPFSAIVKSGICSQSSLNRAIVAASTQRRIGQAGRTPRLQKKDELRLVKELESKIEHGESVTASTVVAEVFHRDSRRSHNVDHFFSLLSGTKILEPRTVKH